jgi:hypothetical protein
MPTRDEMMEDEEENEGGAKLKPSKKKGRRITDLKVSEISVVDKAANGERFLLYKAADDPRAAARRATASDDADAREAAAKTSDMFDEEYSEDPEMEDLTLQVKGDEVMRPLKKFEEKYLQKSEESPLETGDFDEKGVLDLLQKHVK